MLALAPGRQIDLAEPQASTAGKETNFLIDNEAPHSALEARFLDSRLSPLPE